MSRLTMPIDPFQKQPNRIGELIDSSPKTLRQISEEVSINYETLSAYKRQVRYPKKKNAQKLADYFGVSVLYLLGLNDDLVLNDPSESSPTSHELKIENRLKELRKKKGVSQAKVAKIINTNQSQYGKYENGKTKLSLEKSKRLADYFGVSVPYLLGLDDNPERSSSTEDDFSKILARFLNNSSLASKKIDDSTPFKDDVSSLLNISKTGLLESYIDFLTKEKNYHPVVVKAFKQFLKQQSEEVFPYLLNSSDYSMSPYHYIWEEWENFK